MVLGVCIADSILVDVGALKRMVDVPRLGSGVVKEPLDGVEHTLAQKKVGWRIPAIRFCKPPRTGSDLLPYGERVHDSPPETSADRRLTPSEAPCMDGSI